MMVLSKIYQEIFHIAPIIDIVDHKTDGQQCWCHPKYEENVVIHNNFNEPDTNTYGSKLN